MTDLDLLVLTFAAVGSLVWLAFAGVRRRNPPET